MQEFGSPKKNFVYDYSSAIGYEVNIQLRPGERLRRNWSNKGLHVNMTDGEAPGCLNKAIGQDDLRYAPKFGDLAPGRVGNGTLEYDLPLASGAFRSGILIAENLAAQSEDGSGAGSPCEGCGQACGADRQDAVQLCLSERIAVASRRDWRRRRN